MPLDGVRAQEQLGADLRISQPAAGESRNLLLLGSELDALLNRAFADSLASCLQFATGPLGKRFGSDAAEHLMGDPQLFSRVNASLLAPQPLAVDEARSGEMN